MADVTRRRFGAAALTAAAMGSSGSIAASESGGLSDLYDRSDMIDLAAAVRRGHVSSNELLEEAIRRAELHNGDLNAITLKHYDRARDALKKSARGPLAGVPFLLKDLGAQLAGTPTTGGSRSLMGRKAAKNSALVDRYEDSGLVIFGKTNTPEFGMALTTEPTAYGACRNPWKRTHSTGGSSGGSAAAVAAGIVPAAHASDGGGSIRVPAAACGVFGFKPTRLVTPRGQSGDLSPSAMSINHAVTRTVRDSALLLDLTAGVDTGAPFGAPGNPSGFSEGLDETLAPLRIAVALERPNVPVDPAIRAAVDATARRLESLGHHVEEAVLPVNFSAVDDAQIVLVLSEFSLGMQQLARAKKTTVEKLELESLTTDFVTAGARFSANDYVEACQTSYAAGFSLSRFQEQFDVILEPVTSTPAPRLGTINYQPGDTPDSFVERFRRYAGWTYLYNMTGQPSAAVPVGLTDNGLPTSAMLTGRPGEDALILRLSAQLERTAPWFDRRPTLS